MNTNHMDLKILWSNISNKNRKKIIFFLFLLVLSSLLEFVSVGLTLPFIAAITSPDELFSNRLLQPFILFFKINSPNELIYLLTVLFISSIVFAGVVRVLVARVSSYLTQSIGLDLSLKIYNNILYKDYGFFISHNSSEIVNVVLRKVDIVVEGVINSHIVIISSSFLIFGIALTLIIIDPFVAFVLIATILFLYVCIMIYTRRKLILNSNTIATNLNKMVKILQESFGSIRDVILSNSHETHYYEYKNTDSQLRESYANNAFIGASPKYIIETIGVSIVALLAYLMQSSGNNLAIPILATFAIGAQRILPAIQQFYNSYTSIRSSKASFKEILSFLKQSSCANNKPMSGKDFSVRFHNYIEFKNVYYKYNKSDYILQNIKFTIKEGDCIGLVGSTGCGKSTLIDIVMGLLKPDKGDILVDGVLINETNRSSWQSMISHVPQNVYLTDGTIEENIAFGVPKNKINQQKVISAIRCAQLESLVDKWKDGVNTRVGENGVKLSGGQKQRVGIARALYSRRSILILDEATSALDMNTERKIINAINGLSWGVTIIMIAHRVGTLKNCNRIFELSEDSILEKKYSDIA